MSEPNRPGVLVVDDDPQARGYLGRVLRLHGFRPYSAASGEEALAAYELHRGRVAVVLLDVCMCGLDGPGTLRVLRALDPEARCCFITGDLSHGTPQLLALGAERVFAKPLCPSELVRALRLLCEGQG